MDIKDWPAFNEALKQKKPSVWSSDFFEVNSAGVGGASGGRMINSCYYTTPINIRTSDVFTVTNWNIIT